MFELKNRLKNIDKMYLYTRKLQYEHFTPVFRLQNNLCNFTLIRKVVLYKKKTGLDVRFKDL